MVINRAFKTIIIIASLLFYTSSWAGNFNVSGDAEIRVEPDEALISMSAETRNQDLIIAKDDNNKIISKVVEITTKKFGVDKKHLQTNYVNITPEFTDCYSKSRDKCDPTKVTFYKVNKGVLIRLKDLTKFESLMSELINSGVNHVNNVQFLTSELRKHRDQARELAAKAAQEKAEAVAKVLNIKLGQPTSVSLNRSVWAYHGGGFNRAQNVMHAGRSSSENLNENFSLGQISITANVSVSFKIEGSKEDVINLGQIK